MQKIKPLEKRAIQGFVQRVFCDVSYLETLFNAISHSVGHKKWNQIEMDIKQIEICFGDKVELGLKEINNLFIKKTCDILDWQKCFDQIKEEIVCRTKY